MIDVTEEKLIGLRELNDKLPWLSKRYSAQTWWRWTTCGMKGRDGSIIKLETVQEGNRLVTSAAAVMRFFERLAADNAAARTPTQKNRAAEEAAKILDAAGI